MRKTNLSKKTSVIMEETEEELAQHRRSDAGFSKKNSVSSPQKSKKSFRAPVEEEDEDPADKSYNTRANTTASGQKPGRLSEAPG